MAAVIRAKRAIAAATTTASEYVNIRSASRDEEAGARVANNLYGAKRWHTYSGCSSPGIRSPVRTGMGYRPFWQARHDSSLDEQDARRSSGLAHSRGSDGYPEREGWRRRRYRANALESFAAARQHPLEHIRRHGPSA